MKCVKEETDRGGRPAVVTCLLLGHDFSVRDIKEFLLTDADTLLRALASCGRIWMDSHREDSMEEKGLGRQTFSSMLRIDQQANLGGPVKLPPNKQ